AVRPHDLVCVRELELRRLAGDAPALGASDLDREDLRVRCGPGPGARAAVQRDGACGRERVSELQVVRFTGAICAQPAVALIEAVVGYQAAARRILRVALHVDLREYHIR